MTVNAAVQIVGALLIAAGVALVSVPAGLIVLGVLTVLFGIAQELG